MLYDAARRTCNAHFLASFKTSISPMQEILYGRTTWAPLPPPLHPFLLGAPPCPVPDLPGRPPTEGPRETRLQPFLAINLELSMRQRDHAIIRYLPFQPVSILLQEFLIILISSGHGSPHHKPALSLAHAGQIQNLVSAL